MQKASWIETSSRTFLKSTILAAALSLMAACAPAGQGQQVNNANEMPDEPSSETVHIMTAEQAIIMNSISQIGFVEPQMNAETLQQLQDVYSYVDPGATIASDLRNAALAYYHTNQSKISNKTYLTIVDFSKHASLERMYIINMATGSVWNLHVAHGKGSDPSNTGYVHTTSNKSGSNQSSVGFFRTAESYSGKHGLSLRIDGLSSTNSNVRMRDIVVHGASYVSDGNVKAGRSDGCFAVPLDDHTKVVDMLKEGSIIYAAKSAATDGPTVD